MNAKNTSRLLSAKPRKRVIGRWPPELNLCCVNSTDSPERLVHYNGDTLSTAFLRSVTLHRDAIERFCLLGESPRVIHWFSVSRARERREECRLPAGASGRPRPSARLPRVPSRPPAAGRSQATGSIPSSSAHARSPPAPAGLGCLHRLPWLYLAPPLAHACQRHTGDPRRHP